MLDFIVNYWSSILVVVLFIAAIVFFAVRGKKEIVYKMLYALVTEAEKMYGSGTGSVKFAYVVEKIYSYLPAVIKLFITYATLEKWIEKTLAEAKKTWAEKAGIQKYISEPEYVTLPGVIECSEKESETDGEDAPEGADDNEGEG